MSQSEKDKRERAELPDEVEVDDPTEHPATGYGGVLPDEEPEYEEPDVHEDDDTQPASR